MEGLRTLESRKKYVLSVCAEMGLIKGIIEYSFLINQSPKKYFEIKGVYDRKNVGTCAKNHNYPHKLTSWKNESLFPFFIENGFSKNELNDAWKFLKSKKHF